MIALTASVLPQAAQAVVGSEIALTTSVLSQTARAVVRVGVIGSQVSRSPRSTSSKNDRQTPQAGSSSQLQLVKPCCFGDQVRQEKIELQLMDVGHSDVGDREAPR